jgi:hypothetical protein
MGAGVRLSSNWILTLTLGAVAQGARLFLATIFTDPEQHIDDRLAATTALRKFQDVRIMPAIQRPTPSAPPVDKEAEAEERRIAHERKRAHMERMSAVLAEEIARDLAAATTRAAKRSQKVGDSSV